MKCEPVLMNVGHLNAEIAFIYPSSATEGTF